MFKKLLGVFIVIVMSVFLTACDLQLGIDGKKTKIDQTYLSHFEHFFDDSKEKNLTIQISQQSWNELDQKMIEHYQKYEDYRSDFYVKANLSYQDNEGNLFIENIGFRTRGNTSRGRIQDDNGNLIVRNFKISFNAFYPKRYVFGLEEMDLKHAKNDHFPYYDPTYLTEKFSLDLFRSFGVHSAYATLVRLSIQIGDVKHFYGIYTAFEPIDESFLERRFQEDDGIGNLYKCLWQQYGPASLQTITNPRSVGIKNASLNYRPAYDIKNNKKTNRGEDLKHLIVQINTLKGEALNQYLENHVDLDRLIRLLAIGVLLGNPDDYRAMGNNYYLYHHLSSNQWMMIPYDYDHGLGQGWQGEPVFKHFTIGTDIYQWGNLNQVFLNQKNHPHPLVDPLFLNPIHQKTYESYLYELINTPNQYFQFEVFLHLFNQQKALYQPGIEQALNPMVFDLRNVYEYMDLKTKDVMNQLQSYQNHPEKRP